MAGYALIMSLVRLQNIQSLRLVIYTVLFDLMCGTSKESRIRSQRMDTRLWVTIYALGV